MTDPEGNRTLLRVRPPPVPAPPPTTVVVAVVVVVVVVVVLPLTTSFASSLLCLFACGAPFSAATAALALGERVSASFANANRALLRRAGCCVDMVGTGRGERVAREVIDAVLVSFWVPGEMGAGGGKAVESRFAR